MLRNVAPSGHVTSYDRNNLPIYAEMLDAESTGMGWAEGARTILGFDVTQDATSARRCWDSHLARARWIVGDGLGAAVQTFGKRPA